MHLLVLLVAVRIGAALPDAWSRLGPSYVVAVEAGATVWRQRLAIVVDGAFTSPSAQASGMDPAIGAFSATLDVREVIVGASLVYRHPIGRVVPYAGAGPRLVVFDAHETGSAGMGAALPAERELSVGGGGGGFVGVGVRLGPGEAFVDVRADAAPVHNHLSGDVVAGALFVAGGYRLTF
ncbi:MAG TPA: hypothetical protein VF945_02740 [Polyangia bacterium]